MAFRLEEKKYTQTLDHVRFSDASPNLPTRSTGGAPQMSVFVPGCKTRGCRSTSQRANTPRTSPAAAPPSRAGVEALLVVAGVVWTVGGDWETMPFDELGEDGVAIEAGAVACAFSSPRRALRRAFASSSTSSNVSCFTARMEYHQTPTANEPTRRPVRAFRTR